PPRVADHRLRRADRSMSHDATLKSLQEGYCGLCSRSDAASQREDHDKHHRHRVGTQQIRPPDGVVSAAELFWGRWVSSTAGATSMSLFQRWGRPRPGSYAAFGYDPVVRR